MIKLIFAVAIGSSLGGIVRWYLSIKFNPSLLAIPLGTLLSNMIAGYIIGFSIAFFNGLPTLSPEWRLLIITGFCGGLSTFSTFSAEIVYFFQTNKISMGLLTIVIHIVGSVGMTFLGMLSFQWIKGG